MDYKGVETVKEQLEKQLPSKNLIKGYQKEEVNYQSFDCLRLSVKRTKSVFKKQSMLFDKSNQGTVLNFSKDRLQTRQETINRLMQSKNMKFIQKKQL